MESDTKKISVWQKGCALLGLGFLGLVILAIVIGEDDPTGSGGDSPPATMAEKTTALAELQQMRKQALTYAKPCDDASTKLAEQFAAAGSGSGDIYAGYEAALAAERICDRAWKQMDEVDVPEGVDGELKKIADQSLEACREAYAAKSLAAETAAELFDGDMRPSVVSELRRRIDAGNAGLMQCVTRLEAFAPQDGR